MGIGATRPAETRPTTYFRHLAAVETLGRDTTYARNLVAIVGIVLFYRTKRGDRGYLFWFQIPRSGLDGMGRPARRATIVAGSNDGAPPMRS